ncbi:MAG: c-type cytochrome biogenesis protein CcsB [Halanaerobiaceae bacterium]
MDTYIYYIAYGFYLISTAMYISYLFNGNKTVINGGEKVLTLAFLIHTISLLYRWILAARPPLTNQYEFASAFAWGIAVVFLYLAYKHRFNSFGVFVNPVILLIATYSLFLSKEIAPLMPTLQSNWLFFHVFSAVLAYGSFAVSFALGILSIVKHKMTSLLKNLPLEKLDDWIYKTISFGFLLLTLTIITGAIWAQKAWTRYWAWDPKETWSLITWIIYAVFLHLRLNKGVKGSTLAWFSIIGFASVLFTYIGVNYILPGLHSYL